ncbi:MAG TPA: patatin-like phospholipase family protein [Thermoleophilaceae bacterium]
MSVALVMSGGGARGAYEIGVLSVLMPELERRGEKPSIIVGTSVGAFNAAFSASRAHRPAAEALDEGIRYWHELTWADSLEPIGSSGDEPARRRLIAQLLGVRRPRVHGLLDPTPLEKTLRRIVDFDQIARNVADGALDSVAVATTSALTGRTVVFHAGGKTPEHDPVRQIDYVSTTLDGSHIRASSAIPGLFPAVHVDAPERARGWYFDGGTRLNTPLKPALELGADRVVVIGLNSIAPAPEQLAGPHRPDVFEASAQVMQALITDRLTDDMRELAAENAPDGDDHKLVPYVFVAPQKRDEIGAIAARVWNEHYGGVGGLVRDRNLALLGRFVAGGDDAAHGELLSFLLFAPEFAQELIALGQRHARDWLASNPEVWRTGPLPG